MAVTNEVLPVARHNGNGTSDTFAYGFKIFVNTDVRVEVDGVLKTHITHYTVTGVGSPTGGNIVFEATAIPPSGTNNVVIYSQIPATQTTQYPEASKFPSETIEQDFDRRTLVEQQLLEKASRAIRLPIAEAPSDEAVTWPPVAARASKFQAWDSDGNPIAAAGASADLTPVSAFIDTLLDDANAAAARATLEAVADTNGVVTDTLTIRGNAATPLNIPNLLLDNTHATERRCQIQFLDNGTSKWIISSDFEGASGAQTLTIFDAEAGLARLKIDANGVVEIVSGKLKFPATQNASTDVNTLDDYEEGTWTPSVGGTATYVVQDGHYVKIGKIVHLSMYMHINLIGTGATSSIIGVPFPVSTAWNNPNAAATVGYFAGLSKSVVDLKALVNSSGSPNILLYNITAAGASLANDAVMGNGTVLNIQATYETTN